MAVEVREIRADKLERAIEFANAQGGGVDAARVTTALSVVALDGEEVVGVLLSHRAEDGSHEFELAVAEGQDVALRQQLLNVGLMKACARHIGKSRIRFIGDDEAQAMWSSVNWTPGDLTRGEAA